ncbi:MAG: CaiB/BaiF CoA transferase family protein [Halobacteriota archaeon]
MDTNRRMLEDITVLDLTTFVTGGFCSMMLANQGAEVIKIERPQVGDDNRHSGPPFVDGESPYFWTINYGKKSVELDLKSEAGREALYQLVGEADVFLQNFRPGTAPRLGVDYERIREARDDIVYCAISAYGQTGPWSHRPGYDLLIQGMSGIMSVTGESDGPPIRVGLPQTDLITAMWAAFGIVSAIRRRDQTGEGEYIDLGMLDAAIPWLTKQAGKVFAGVEAERLGNRDPVLAPYQTFPTADGHINLAGINPKLWTALCEAIDRPDLLEDERFQGNANRVTNLEALQEELVGELTKRTTDEWISVFDEAGVPVGAVLSVEEALNSPQVEARNVLTTTERDGTEIPTIEHPLNYEHAESGFERAPPLLGEHTREVLSAAGLSDEEIEAVERANAPDE